MDRAYERLLLTGPLSTATATVGGDKEEGGRVTGRPHYLSSLPRPPPPPRGQNLRSVGFRRYSASPPGSTRGIAPEEASHKWPCLHRMRENLRAQHRLKILLCSEFQLNGSFPATRRWDNSFPDCFMRTKAKSTDKL